MRTHACFLQKLPSSIQWTVPHIDAQDLWSTVISSPHSALPPEIALLTLCKQRILLSHAYHNCSHSAAAEILPSCGCV